MHAATLRVIRCLTVVSSLVGGGACASRETPVPETLRARDFPLVRVDGQRVLGEAPAKLPVGSRDAKADCQNRVADGTLRISHSGRSFTYHSTMRDCSGRALVTETNEGVVSQRDSQLNFVIRRSDGTAEFRGRWSDSTITIVDLGGLLEFTRLGATP